MIALGVTFNEYCSICLSFENWYNYRSLSQFFGELEKYPSLAIEYYDNLENDFSNQQGSYYRAYTDRISTWLSKTIKHKNVAELYRFVDN